MTAPAAAPLDDKQLQELESKFDPEMRFRPTLPPADWIVKALLIALSLFHFYTAGFGLLRETTHRGVHLAFVLGLIFLVFAAGSRAKGPNWARITVYTESDSPPRRPSRFTSSNQR